MTTRVLVRMKLREELRRLSYNWEVRRLMAVKGNMSTWYLYALPELAFPVYEVVFSKAWVSATMKEYVTCKRAGYRLTSASHIVTALSERADRGMKVTCCTPPD